LPLVIVLFFKTPVPEHYDKIPLLVKFRHLNVKKIIYGNLKINASNQSPESNSSSRRATVICNNKLECPKTEFCQNKNKYRKNHSNVNNCKKQ